MNRNAKVGWQSLSSRITGLSLFGFGGNWSAPEPERVVVRDIITVLEDRRALYVQAVWEQPDYVIQSVLRIREELTSGLQRIADGSPAKEAFRVMRAACRDFLNLPSTKALEGHRGMLRGGSMWEEEEFFVGLGQLRGVFGQQLAVLGYLYGIDIEPQLASILPPKVEE